MLKRIVVMVGVMAFFSAPAFAQAGSDQLATLINRSPEQYWWLHRRWKGEPRQRKSRKRAA